MRTAAAALMAASGFAGLGYQIVWTQQGALALGHDAAAVLAVVTAFFGGLALGAWALGRRLACSARPARAYALCEAAIGLWSLMLALALPRFTDALLAATGPAPSAAWQWSVAFAGMFFALLPSTVAMGATLPALERVLRSAEGRGRDVGLLYAANTFGAVLGALAAALWLVPSFGLTRTAVACAALNLLCAAGAWRLGGAGGSGTAAQDGTRQPVPWMLAATGLLGIGFEVLVVRVLSQVTEDTVYTFAMLLAVYLLGTAAGAAAWHRWLAGRGSEDLRRRRLLLAQAAACGGASLALWVAPVIRDAVTAALGPGFGTALAGEAALAVAAFALPTAVMGALFSELCAQATRSGHGLGGALAANLLGGALAPPLFGVLLAPALGPAVALAAVAAGYALLAAAGSARRWVPVALAASIAAVPAVLPPLAFVDVPPGGHVVSYREGALGAVSVVADAQGVKRLFINNRQQEGSSASGWADGRQAWLPLLLAPGARDILFLGLGTGMTARAAAADAALHVRAAELLPEVVAASREFGAGPVEISVADARRFVRTSARRHDLIVADNFHPARSGSGALYTVEHFSAVRDRLAPAGVFCQWLPLHQLDLDTLRSIVRSFQAAFPGAGAVLATQSLQTPVLGLVARADGGLHAAAAPAGASALARQYGFDDAYAVLGSFVAGPSALRRLAGDAPLNTDDRPVVAYRAPHVTYAPDSTAADRLLALLPTLGVADGELFDAAPGVLARLAAYRAARDRFLQAGRGVQPAADVHHMLAQVREPLLAVLRLSPDFQPAYEPLLRMAQALGSDDPAAGRELLAELQRVRPARPEAAAALARLGSTAP